VTFGRRLSDCGICRPGLIAFSSGGQALR